jgi:hypothetical protein
MAKQRPRICDKCGAENTPRAKSCAACGGEKWAPDWIHGLRRVNRQFTVTVTKPRPEFGTDYRLTLSKWWPSNRANFNINSAAQWDAVRNAADELAPLLGWSTREELVEALRDREKTSKVLDRELKKAAANDAELLERIAKGIDFKKVSEEDLPEVARQLGVIAGVLVNADREFRLAIEALVKKLPAQGKKATTGLAEMMEQLTLRQITAVTSEVQRRVELLSLFKSRMLDDRTYEIRGDNSIHRLLEGAMWIVDERYWLMHSNSTLRTVVGNELAKEDKKFQKNRPDFVCGTVGKRLVLIEIKRPSHTLEVDDLNQLERYVYICEKYSSDYSSLEAAILVGQKQSPELIGRMKHRSNAFKVRTYSDLVQDTEQRYKSYLDAMSE